MSISSKNKRVKLDTLGCKLNQAETELLAGKFVGAGYRLTSSLDEADIYILNTCTVTHIADRKSRHLLRMARRRNPAVVIVAAGCYVQRARQQLTDVDGVNMVLGNDDKMHMVRLLEAEDYLDKPDSNQGYLQIENKNILRNRAFIKAQDGCDNFCAYCIVPMVRGREESLPVEQVIVQVKNRVGCGYKEVVLTGTEIGSYRYNGVGLNGLVEEILHKTDITRLRLSSLQTHHITPQLMELWRNTRLCPHLHLSLQSGSDNVLVRMKRRYSASDYSKAISLVRSIMPQAAVTTDVIVGFPGESEDEFEESYSFCKGVGFARIHVFPFSPRPGTEADKMKGQIGDKVKKQRSEKMLALAEESARSFRKRFLGKTIPVLWEQKSNGIWSGLTGNYIRVYTKSSEDLTNKITEVKLEKIWKDGVWGE
ncbi:MAG: tRNA (N(6)-L-threonylcarbamoyladenosine(37)-C(2))-methylthiotransferase MtaB [Dehalococcoidales bacterium]|nr:tRNA (N(6)-L-threonylcarbamoyladenosine(37)-C(2))-methylthiotransferase MtaB [Dehalococcoidales bacterium]